MQLFHLWCSWLRTIDKRITLALAAICAIYLGLDDLVTALPSGNNAFAFINGKWNWTGKIYSILLSVSIIIALRIHPESIGLRLKQDKPKLAIAAVAGFIIWGVFLGLLFEIYGVGLESGKENWLKAIERDKRIWINVSTFQEFETSVTFDYAVTSLPANVLVDNSGKVIAKNLYGNDLKVAVEKLFSREK